MCIQATKSKLMVKGQSGTSKFNIAIVGQQGRLSYEAVIFAASLRQSDPGFSGRLLVMEPQPGPLWPSDPRIIPECRDLLVQDLGAEILPFDNHHFGASYPNGNKIEGLAALPVGEPFVFFDTDTLITGPVSAVPFDFDRPGASQRVSGTWPTPQLYGATYEDIWRSLYDRFGLEFESSLDNSQPVDYWARYLYFNAGWFFYRDPAEFGKRFLDIATSVWTDRPKALAAQKLTPWLDQIALPLVIHGLGGGRDILAPGLLDGAISNHYRSLPLLFATSTESAIETLTVATAPNRIKKVLKTYEPALRYIYQGRGRKVRAMFDQSALPPSEQVIRNRIKKAGLWMR